MGKNHLKPFLIVALFFGLLLSCEAQTQYRPAQQKKQQDDQQQTISAHTTAAETASSATTAASPATTASPSSATKTASSATTATSPPQASSSSYYVVSDQKQQDLSQTAIHDMIQQVYDQYEMMQQPGASNDQSNDETSNAPISSLAEPVVRAGKVGDEQYFEAEKYRLGVEYSQDIEKALSLYHEASQNHPHDEALYAIGLIYLLGEGHMSINLSLAFQYLNESASLGNAAAQGYLGFLYANGIGVEQNLPLSILYSTFASHGADLNSLLVLGDRHIHGYDVIQSCDIAVQYYEAAARAVVADIESTGVVKAWSTGSHIAEDYNRGRNRVEEQQDVLHYYTYAADSGDSQAQLTMGSLHLHGSHGVQQDYKKAHAYFVSAASSFDHSALAFLGFMLLHGYGVAQDTTLALTYLNRAAQSDNSIALYFLGTVYKYGIGATANPQKAFNYFKKSADLGHADAACEMGLIYWSGYHGVVKQDLNNAVHWLQISASQGNLRASHYYAKFFQAGLGPVRKTCLQAVSLYKRVAERAPVAAMLQEAGVLYENGFLEKALIRYEIAAYAGLELAQANAAFIYDHFDLQPQFSANQTDKLRRALGLYMRDADQLNSGAYLKLGDYYYYGKGGLQQDVHQAAQRYRMSSDLSNAQAAYNLALMYHTGDGLPKDFFLAKRYYDTAAEKDHAAFPVTVGLILLGASFVIDHVQEKGLLTLPFALYDFFKTPIPKSTGAAAVPTSPSQGASSSAQTVSSVSSQDPLLNQLEKGGGYDPETLLIIGLSALLVVILFVRYQQNARLRAMQA